MADIAVYGQVGNYMCFQEKRPDYTQAIKRSIFHATQLLKVVKEPIIADFCCGTGNNTKLLADSIGGIQKAVLIDINKGFLDIAKKSGIKAQKIDIQQTDIINARLPTDCDLVLSIFAYHHVSDDKKRSYLVQAKKCLRKGGFLVLTEIYLNGKSENLAYYQKLLEAIPLKDRLAGLAEFLNQTAESSDFEFKVTKEFAEDQLNDVGFVKVLEEKIWPSGDLLGKNRGTFVSIYKLKQ